MGDSHDSTIGDLGTETEIQICEVNTSTSQESQADISKGGDFGKVKGSEMSRGCKLGDTLKGSIRDLQTGRQIEHSEVGIYTKEGRDDLSSEKTGKPTSSSSEATKMFAGKRPIVAICRFL